MKRGAFELPAFFMEGGISLIKKRLQINASIYAEEHPDIIDVQPLIVATAPLPNINIRQAKMDEPCQTAVIVKMSSELIRISGFAGIIIEHFKSR